MIKQILYLILGVGSTFLFAFGIVYLAIKLNDWLYNEKMDSQNIGSYNYDSYCNYWGRIIYYLEHIFDYGFHHFKYKKKGIYKKKA